MRWPEVVDALLFAVNADDVLSAIFGPNVYRAGDRDLRVPALEYSIISDVENERYNPLRIQWDVFVRRDSDLVAAERMLRFLFNHDLPTVIAGVPMWAEYVARSDIPGLRDGIRGSSTDFRFTPVRTRYVRAEDS